MSDKRLKRVAVLVGTTLLTVVTVGALLGSRSAADDLQDKSERALSAAHLEDVRVAFHGREAELSGGTPDDLSKAELIVEGIEGVRWANVVSAAVGPTPAPRDTTPTLHLGRTGSGISISGTVPDPDAAASVKASVAEAFGEAVTGDVVIDASVGSADWIDQLPDVLNDLVGVKRLTLAIDGQGTLDLGGSIESRAGADDVRRRLASAVPGLKIVSRLDVQPNGLSEAAAAVLNTSALQFPADRSTLSGPDQRRLDEVADVLRDNPELAIEAFGYAGPKHPGATERLTLARVAAVKAYLVKAGVDGVRVSTRALASQSRTALSSDQQFRRVDFVVKAD
ncbi:OmpA family protein [Aeromicrobium sp. 9AM]|uniref:OmpA family protein n=1 Tax=Aeromicrobium sp. 9AM TaxID=2653126 RepID=UPI0012F43349|nr:OmpA family protein [Aeromicrobium sp. 9AM]VXC23914.1 conserved exported hypothetical protein [Aeromicrobium sp. 9AM]